MNNIEELIYNELRSTRELLQDYMVRTDNRISILEQFKSKAMGVCIVIGIACKCAWDYIAERFV